MALDTEGFARLPRQGRGVIDCDIHPTVPSTEALLPYLDDYWREHITIRGLHRTTLTLNSYPPDAPTTVRKDWREENAARGSALNSLKAQALDPFRLDLAICNPLYGANGIHGDNLAAVLCRAVNDWIAKEWLDRDPRLRASIVVPMACPEKAVEEIERLAGDARFVQVLLLVMGEMPLGRRFHWPIYEAAERHGLPIGVHAGATYRQVPSATGWPTYYFEDYVLNASAAETQLMSFVAEGVFERFPELTVVFLETGFMWLPPMMWRANKTWRGVRAEVPWIKRAPAEIIRERVRFTLQPVDAPPDASMLEATLEQIGSDEFLLFSTDYPHWHFDGSSVAPEGFPAELLEKAAWENPLNTYPRLRQSLPQEVAR